MDNQKKKCNSKNHSEINAIIYCNECKKYFCKKCQNHHNDLLEEHRTINLNNLDDIFIDKCKENNHINKLEFYCKKHNILCCGLCITKIKEKGYGQHSDCEVCLIENIKDEKKNKLKENIKCLEELENKVNESIKSLKIIFEDIEKNKDNLRLEISKYIH